MPIPLLVGFGSVVGGWITSNSKTIFKLFLLGTFLAALTAFSVWFVAFSGDIYTLITSSTSELSTNYSGLLGCVLEKLGLDEFINSAFSIFYTAAIFWVTAVGYIITYKLGLKAYDGFFKALS